MRISVIIPVFNGQSFLPAFFESLAAAAPADTQLILVDDGSTEMVSNLFPTGGCYSEILALSNGTNLGYSAAVNRGIAVADGEVIIQLNTDLLLDRNCINALIEGIVSRPKAGVVGSKLLFPTTGRIQHAGMAFGQWSKRHVFLDMRADHPLCRTRRVQIMSGAIVGTSRSVLERLGPLDERYYNCSEDLDHCMRAGRLGLENWILADSVAYHWVSQSGPARFAGIREGDALFWSLWAGERQVDLDRFVDEALDFALESWPDFAGYPFVPLDLTRTHDNAILLGCIERRWPGAGRRTVSCRTHDRADSALHLPMLLPHRALISPLPYLYLVDRSTDLAGNRLWFETRLGLVNDELMLDSTAAVHSVSEFLAERMAK